MREGFRADRFCVIFAGTELGVATDGYNIIGRRPQTGDLKSHFFDFDVGKRRRFVLDCDIIGRYFMSFKIAECCRFPVEDEESRCRLHDPYVI